MPTASMTDIPITKTKKIAVFDPVYLINSRKSRARRRSALREVVVVVVVVASGGGCGGGGCAHKQRIRSAVVCKCIKWKK